MRDEKHTPEVGTWLKGREVRPADSQDTARRVAARLPQVRQRSRWWPLPVFYRRHDTPTASDATEDRPSPIPASNGHTPTVIGRTTSMLSPVKAITAGAIVFAIGGVMLVAQPFQQQSSVPGAEAEAITPTWVTGEIEFAPSCEDPATSTVDGVLQQRNFRCSPQAWRSDDPRVTGTGTVAHSSDAYTTEDGTYQVISSAFEVRNDAGGWHCTNADALLAGTSLFDASLQEFHMTCLGDGDYAGATAILVVDFTDLNAPTKPFEGLVFPGVVPPFPETSPDE